MRNKIQITIFALSFLSFAGVLIGSYLYFQNNEYFPLRSKAETTTQTSPTAYPSQPSQGWLSAKGTSLYDKNNSYIRLKGVNTQVYVPRRVSTQCWEPPEPNTITNLSSWGFNVSSIPFTWGLMEPSAPTKNPDGSWSHNWNQSYLDSLDNTIAQMTTKNIYIILKLKPAWVQFSESGSCSGGGMPPWLYPGIDLAASIDQLKCDFYVKPDTIVSGAPLSPQSGALEVWKFMVNRYKNNSNVIGIDIINEPYADNATCTAQTLRAPLKNFYLKIGNAVRQINPNLLLIFQDSSNGKARRGEFTLDGPLELPNAVYSFHLYQETWDDAKIVVDAYLNRAKQWNIPVWMGEFHPIGPSGNPTSDPNWTSYTQSLMDYLKREGVSWGLTNYSGCCGVVDQQNLPRWDIINILQSGFDSSVQTPPPQTSPTQTSPTLTSPTLTKTPPVPSPFVPPSSSGVSMTLKLSFQGIVTKPKKSVMPRVAVKIVSSSNLSSAPQHTDFVWDDPSRTFQGTLFFPDVQAGSGYKLLVKGPMHLQKAICDSRPRENNARTRPSPCTIDNISLSPQTTLDLSGVRLLAGDVPPQDGVSDSYDLSYLRTNLLSKNPKVLSKADFNLDNIIDTQDLALLNFSLSSRVDEK